MFHIWKYVKPTSWDNLTVVSPTLMSLLVFGDWIYKHLVWFIECNVTLRYITDIDFVSMQTSNQQTSVTTNAK